MMILGKTKKCIVCNKKATKWKGFIIKSRDKVKAGFCNEHKSCECPNLFKIGGCFGVYDKSLGWSLE